MAGATISVTAHFFFPAAFYTGATNARCPKGRVYEILIGCLRCDTRQEVEQLIQREYIGDIAIEPAVNELLRARDRNKSDALSSTQTLLSTALPSSVVAELTLIGLYTLMEKIGEGGMGFEYLARQIPRPVSPRYLVAERFAYPCD